MSQQQMETANKFLQQANFAEAGKIFRQVWEEENNGYAASRYLYCLRKANYPQAAVKQGEKAYLEFPNNAYLQRELIWAYYELIKIAENQEDLSQVVQTASIILKLNPEKLPLELTVFAVIKLAKAQGKWQTVSDWCDQIHRSQLSDDIPTIGEQKGKSKKEQWYFGKIKSLIELAFWEQARSLALEAINLYPKEINFPRWAAIALANLGKIQDAIDEFKNLILKQREKWFIFQDLSELYMKINQPELALKFVCKAALAPGEDKTKVTLYQNIAQIGLLMNKLDLAARHIQLCLAIRQQENWSIKADLQQLDLDINQAFSQKNMKKLEECNDLNNLRKICQKYWVEANYQGLARQTGYIESLSQDKPYGWIRSQDGQKVFFLQKELPKFLRQENLKVDFALEESWDRSKGKLSFKAVDIRVEK